MEVKAQDATISQPRESEITQISPASHHNQSRNEKAESTTTALSTDSLSEKYGWPRYSLEITHDDNRPSSSSNLQPQPQPQPQRSRSVNFATNQPSSHNETWKFSKSFNHRRSHKASLGHHQPINEKVESTTSSALPMDSLSERHGWTSNSLENSHDNPPSSSNNPQPQLRSRGSRVVHLPIDQLFRISSTGHQRRVRSKSFDHQRSHKASANGKMESTTSVLSIRSLSERYGWTPYSLEIAHDGQPSSSNNPQPQRQSQGSHIDNLQIDDHLPIDELYRTPSCQRPIGSKSFDHQRSCKDSSHHHQQGNGEAEFTTSILPTRSLSERFGRTPHSLESTHDSQPSSCHNPQPLSQSQGSHTVHLPNDQLYHVPSNHNQIHVNSESFDHQRSHKIPPCCLFFSGILLIFIVLLMAAGFILYLLLMPERPRFFIENISFIFTQSDLQKLHPNYNFSMGSENPNHDVGIHYLDSGGAFLSYNSQEIATGQPPALYHGKKVTMHFNLLLESKDVLPKEMEDILKENKSRAELPLLLYLHIPVKMRLWKLQRWRMRMKILCHVSIFVLAKEADLESQDCEHTLFYSY